MSTAGIIITAVVAVVVLAAITLVTAARRSDVRGAGELTRETRRRDRSAPLADAADRGGIKYETAVVEERTAALVPKVATTPEIFVKPDAEAIGVSRRQFFNRAAVTLMSASLGTFFAAGFLAFLWPFKTAGFGGKVAAGKIDDVVAGIRAGKGFLYNSTARSYLTAYPSEALPKARAIPAYKALMSSGGMDAGLVALYQKCPHLGCRVPQCESSQWFECPCHGSQYNRVGEKKGGPAPRGMDHFIVTVGATGDVTIDTANVIQGAPIGTNTTGQEAEGPHCIGGGGH